MKINVTELIEISSSEVFFFIKIAIVLDFTGVWFKLRLAGHCDKRDVTQGMNTVNTL